MHKILKDLKYNMWTERLINGFLRIIKTTHQKAEGTKEDHWRDLWMCKTETGQQEAQIHDSYMMMIMMMMMMMKFYFI